MCDEPPQPVKLQALDLVRADLAHLALDDRRSEMRDELDAVRWSDPRSGCLSVLR